MKNRPTDEVKNAISQNTQSDSRTDSGNQSKDKIGRRRYTRLSELWLNFKPNPISGLKFSFTRILVVWKAVVGKRSTHKMARKDHQKKIRNGKKQAVGNENK